MEDMDRRVNELEKKLERDNARVLKAMADRMSTMCVIDEDPDLLAANLAILLVDLAAKSAWAMQQFKGSSASAILKTVQSMVGDLVVELETGTPREGSSFRMVPDAERDISTAPRNMVN